MCGLNMDCRIDAEMIMVVVGGELELANESWHRRIELECHRLRHLRIFVWSGLQCLRAKGRVRARMVGGWIGVYERMNAIES